MVSCDGPATIKTYLSTEPPGAQFPVAANTFSFQIATRIPFCAVSSFGTAHAAADAQTEHKIKNWPKRKILQFEDRHVVVGSLFVYDVTGCERSQ